jgi:proteasome lid subunit RPN8/RPN11
MTLHKPWVSPEIVDQVLEFGRAEEPNEACGVITPDSMVTLLPNSSPSPKNSFVIATKDLVNAINEYAERSKVDVSALTREHFILWHTHPGGVVGPSAGDLRERLGGFQYLVVSLPWGEAVQF